MGHLDGRVALAGGDIAPGFGIDSGSPLARSFTVDDRIYPGNRVRPRPSNPENPDGHHKNWSIRRISRIYEP